MLRRFLAGRIGKALRKSRRRCAATGAASRRFREFRYRTLKSWSRSRRVGLAGTRWANAQCGTLRAKLLKVAARLRVTARKVWLSFSSVYPHQSEFAAALAALRRVPVPGPPD